MRVLFDHGVPSPLRDALPAHEVATARKQGWESVNNGELLAHADAEFDVLVTADKNMRHQQDISRLRRIGVVVIVERFITPDTVLPLAPEIDRALLEVQPGQFRDVGDPERDRRPGTLSRGQN